MKAISIATTIVSPLDSNFETKEEYQVEWHQNYSDGGTRSTTNFYSIHIFIILIHLQVIYCINVDINVLIVQRFNVKH